MCIYSYNHLLEVNLNFVFLFTFFRYLDKQEFLQRVDYKQWESEREMRLYTNRK